MNAEVDGDEEKFDNVIFSLLFTASHSLSPFLFLVHYIRCIAYRIELCLAGG